METEVADFQHKDTRDTTRVYKYFLCHVLNTVRIETIMKLPER